MTVPTHIRALEEQDFQFIKEIYEQGIKTRNATFETQSPEWDEWNKKFLPKPRFVAEINKKVAGWAVLSAISSRPVYSGVVKLVFMFMKIIEERESVKTY